MKFKKVVAAGLTAAMAASLAACSSGSSNSGALSDIKYSDITLGETYSDVSATIKVLTNRTDMLKDDYKGKNWDAYVKEFNELYPNIKVEFDGITNYAEDSLIRLSSGDWGDVMLIPEVDKQELPNHFLSYGDLDSMNSQVKYANQCEYNGQVYGVASSADARGLVYNKKVFQEAGITELPKTPEEFQEALKKIKDNTDAVPLYTNYVSGWTMTAWDDYIGATSTGDKNYKNNVMLHTSNPFSDTNDGTHPYSVYKVLYDAVANGYTEDDFSTTDWETSKTMLNQGKIGCMALGSWSYLQMQQAGPNASDIGYMAFPISVNGKQYVTTSPNYKWGINVKSSEDNQKASMVFVKWLTEKSKFAYNEGGLPIKVDDNDYPEAFQGMVQNNVEFITDEPAVSGEESLLNDLNADSELMISAGKEKIQAIIEHAAKKDESFDDIMKEWNEKWTKAQESNNVTVDK